MIPYVDFSYFTLLLYPVVPAAVLGLAGRLRPWLLLIATAALLWVQFSGALAGQPGTQIPYFLAFCVWEAAVVYGFAWLRRRHRVPAAYYAAVVLVLLPLVAVKVFPLLAAHPSLWPWAGLHPGIHGPLAGPSNTHQPTAPSQGPLVAGLQDTFGFLGVSYMTFRVLDAVIVLQDGLIDTPRPGLLANYVLFFPCASAGPIDRYRRFAADLAAPRAGRAFALDLDRGLYRIAQGFLYKFIIGELIYRYWLTPVAEPRGPVHMVLYMYAYTLYLFFDFAGYSAFAIGVSNLFGIHTPENFRAPFLARNFRDFWNRWFITLSWFLRDHIYMRFVLGATRRRWLRNRYAISYIGFVLTMGAMGLWHGLELHYIAYGLYQAVMLIVYDFLGRLNRRRKWIPANRLTDWISIGVTFNLVCFGMLIFSGHLFQ